MRALLAFCLALVLGHPASALSCLPKDFARDYQAAAQSKDRYIIVHGTLFFDDSKLPKRDNRLTKPQDVTVTAWLDGQSLTPEGFTRPFERDVSLRITCLAHWCGAVSNGEHLLFLKQENQSFVAEIGPCFAFIYPEPNAAVLDQALSCIRGEACDPDTPSGSTD